MQITANIDIYLTSRIIFNQIKSSTLPQRDFKMITQHILPNLLQISDNRSHTSANPTMQIKITASNWKMQIKISVWVQFDDIIANHNIQIGWIVEWFNIRINDFWC